MIAYIQGEVLDTAEDSLVLLAGGIGYRVYAPVKLFAAPPVPGDEIALHTYLQINTQPRAEALALFGFPGKQELALFELLLGVSSIGAKTALAALNSLGYDGIVGAVQTGNSQTLTAIPGVGKKSAERILLELKDKIMKLEPSYLVSDAPPATNDLAANLRRTAALALTQLGYTQAEAQELVDKAAQGLPDDTALEDMITAALQLAARG